MAYISLRQQPGPNGTVRRPGDHMPEADAWPNPKLWVDRGHVRWVPDADVADGRWRDFEEFAKSGAGGRALKALVEAKGAAPAKPPPDARPVRRLPLLEEYVRAGYAADRYAAFLAREKAQLEAAGFRVEVRAPNAEEAILEREGARRMEEAAAPPRQPVEPAQPPVEPVAQVEVPPAAPAAQPELALDQSPEAPASMPPLPSRRELELMHQPELWELAHARGLAPEAGLGKGKLLKLLTK